MAKKKLLIFIDWYKPGYKAGGPIRSISNLTATLGDKLDIHIITRDTDYLETTPYTIIESNKWNIIDSTKVYYLSNNNINRANIKKLIQEVNPELVYCNSLYSPYFTLIPIYLAKKLNIQSVLAIRGMLSEGSLGVKSHKKKLFLLVTKTIGLFKKCTFHATTIDEKKAIQNTFGKQTPIIIAQNLPEKKNIPFQEKEKEVNHLRIVNIGRVAPEKNTLYALEVLKEITSNILFDIYGPIYDQGYWDKCKVIISQLPKNVVVNYKGVLPHKDLDGVLKNYQVFFSPSTGENFGHSIIEAMINSCIPIISDQTPWVKLEEKNIGFDLPLNAPLLFAKKIDQLALMDKSTLNKISYKTHQFAKKTINDHELIKKYTILFK